MATIQDLREQHAILAKKANDFLNEHESDWKSEHTDQWDSMESEISDIEDKIRRREKMAKIDSIDASTDGILAITDRLKHGSQDKNTLVQFEAALRSGDFSQFQAEMSTEVGSEGGYTVPVYVANRWIDELKAYGGMRQVSQIMRTADGNTINYPTSNVTDQMGAILAENEQASELDPKFGQIVVPTYEFTSKVVRVPRQLISDAAFSIEAFVTNHLLIRIGRITEKMFTNGSGDKEPLGIITATTSGKTAQAASITYDDLIDLQHSVDYAYRESSQCAFMMHDQTVAAIRKIKDDENRPIFVPGYQMQGSDTMVNRLLGVPIVVNNNMSPVGPGVKSVLFGDFGRYLIRDVQDMQMLRMSDSNYSTRNQIGFCIMSRHGGSFVDTGGAVRSLDMPATATKK